MDHKQALKLLYLEVFHGVEMDPKDLNCIFVLSTGRCGTQTMSQVLHLSPNIAAFHEPMPHLWEYSSRALHLGLLLNTILLKIVKSARIDLISTINAMGYHYAECQHRFTFFAPSIKSIFPKAKFIYLRRDMDEFVSSAIQWHWYNIKIKESTGKPADPYIKNRIQPDHDEKDQGKILAWSWCATNEFIHSFLKTIPKSDWTYFDFNWIKYYESNYYYNELFDWLRVQDVDGYKIHDVLKLELNRGRREIQPKTWEAYDDRAKKITEQINMQT